MQSVPGIAVVTRETRLQGLRARWGTVRQAEFVLKQAHLIETEGLVTSAKGLLKSRKHAKRVRQTADADFSEYEREDNVYQNVLGQLHRELDFGLPIKFLDRSLVPTADFSRFSIVVVVGQDGLVANVAKYVGDLPIVAINPDPAKFDGILLPFQPQQARQAVSQVLHGRHELRHVTLAEVRLSDGQRMLAFNDFFVGAASHISARYVLQVAGKDEPQSSSGVLISTGAGSTGWISSVFNMARGVSHLVGGDCPERIQMGWEDRRLIWAVREPFASKHSRTDNVAGLLDEGQELVIESLMPSGGVIFSDGVEADFLTFNTGVIARLAAAQQVANLVVG